MKEILLRLKKHLPDSKDILPSFISLGKITTEENFINSLAPRILKTEKEISVIKPYLKKLKETVAAKGVTNIALAGVYGSGKSTILKTFQHQNPEYDYLNLSLASFKNIDGKSLEWSEELERRLEVSILQQIFYHVKPSEIPDSRFKRIVNLTSNKIWFIAVGLIFWVASALILFKADYIDKINPSTWNNLLSFDWLAFLVFIIFFIGIGLFAKTVTRLFSNSKITKFNIKGELELGDNKENSAFNAHLEEIIYFFERTDYNVVIIEDLDRFDRTDIFTKLREINILLNNSQSINREINFIYALKDEMFTDKTERVKFFEYIIPVIPFINPSNAGEQLTRLINEANITNSLSKDFTEDVVTFIDDIDMRLLTNIFHEYQIYNENLSKDLNQDKLFAIITYKNLFPNDFGNLHKRKGNMFAFLDNKNVYLRPLVEKIDSRIEMLNYEIEAIESESIVNFEELNAIYVNAIRQNIPDAVSLIIDGSEVTFNALMEDDEFEKLLNNKKIKYNYFQLRYSHGSEYSRLQTTSTISFSDIEKLVNTDYGYEDRKHLIIDKEENKIEMIKAEIGIQKSRKVEIEAWSLQQIFVEVDINPHLETSINNPLVRTLLLNGYIDENYNDYISLFHDINITQEDYTFERNVKSGISLQFDYKLTQIKNLIKKIPEKYFGRDVILNLDLVDFLGANYDSYNIYYDKIIKVLNSEKEKTINFIDSYLEKRITNQSLFIKKLTKSWSGFFDFIYLRSNYTAEKVEMYVILIVKYADLNDLITRGSNLAVYIREKSNFLSLISEPIYTQKIKSLLKELNIKFDSLEIPDAKTKVLFDYVYENNHYALNAENIALIASQKGEITSNLGIKLEKSNYTTILESKAISLIKYVEENINEYVKDVILKLDKNTDEKEEVLVKLLNDKSLNIKHKSMLISKQDLIITKLSTITEIEVQREIMDQNKMVSSWSNIFAYYDKLDDKEFDQTMHNYLNEEISYSILQNDTLTKADNKPESYIKEFRVKILYNNNLSLDAYSKLMNVVGKGWSNVKYKSLDSDKVKFLVQNGYISLKIGDYKDLKENFPNSHILLAEIHQIEFAKTFENYEVDSDDFLVLMKSNSITNPNKVKFIQKADDSMIIENKDIGNAVCNILSISPAIPLEYDLLKSLIKNSKYLPDCIKLINLNFSKLSNSDAQTLIGQLGGKYPELFVRMKRPTFHNVAYNLELFKNLEKRNMIIRFEKDKNPELIRVFAKH